MKKKLPGSGPYAVFTVKVTLLGTEPPIWRQLRLPASTTLADLHWVLQTAFDWTNSHMHHFMLRFGTDNVAYYGLPEKRLVPDLGFGHDTKDETKARLGNLLGKAGDVCRYEYDFGDSWLHEIALEEIAEECVRPVLPLALPASGLPRLKTAVASPGSITTSMCSRNPEAGNTPRSGNGWATMIPRRSNSPG